jgi:hypothetical protein
MSIVPIDLLLPAPKYAAKIPVTSEVTPNQSVKLIMNIGKRDPMRCLHVSIYLEMSDTIY